MEMCRSCFINTKYKCLRCELPACNKCSVLKQNEDVRDRQPAKALHTLAYCEVSDRDLKFQHDGDESVNKQKG